MSGGRPSFARAGLFPQNDLGKYAIGDDAFAIGGFLIDAFRETRKVQIVIMEVVARSTTRRIS